MTSLLGLCRHILRTGSTQHQLACSIGSSANNTNFGSCTASAGGRLCYCRCASTSSAHRSSSTKEARQETRGNEGGRTAALFDKKEASAAVGVGGEVVSDKGGGRGSAGARVATTPPVAAPHLQALRRLPATGPDLRGQVILARVLQVCPEEGAVLVDPGYYGTCRLSVHDFRSSVVYDATGNVTDRSVADGVGPGEYVTATLSKYFTPYGALELAPLNLPQQARRELVWAELMQLHLADSPVWGRVLNYCSGGYAVGVAGYVALLPFHHCNAQTAQRIGSLQPFYIATCDPHERRLVLCDQHHRQSLDTVKPQLQTLYSNIGRSDSK